MFFLGEIPDSVVFHCRRTKLLRTDLYSNSTPTQARIFACIWLTGITLRDITIARWRFHGFVLI